MTSAQMNRLDIEDFLFHEADCLDRWDMDAWIALWDSGDDVAYEVTPTSEREVSDLAPESTMFLIADNRYRLEQRMIRMKKNSFHAEYHRSRTRHMYGHVRILAQTDTDLDISFNAAVYRTKDEKTVVYPSLVRAKLRKTPQGLRFVKKRIELDLERLATMGALTILL
ncbi:MAG: aromatic-ring-hydroxylating dioxygenase subunit beta [Porticoccaceae bacterium]